MLKIYAAYFIGMFLLILTISVIMDLKPYYRYINWVWHKWRFARATRTVEAHVLILLDLQKRWYPEMDLNLDNITLKNEGR